MGKKIVGGVLFGGVVLTIFAGSAVSLGIIKALFAWGVSIFAAAALIGGMILLFDD